MSTLEFWSGVIVLLIPQLISLVRDLKAVKANAPLTHAQAQDSMGDALEKLGVEYARMMTINGKLQEEINTLRPLTLKLAVAEQNLLQSRRDKEDWKRYAGKLVEQVETLQQVPIPFRRLPPNGDSQKLSAITDDMMNEYARTGVEPEIRKSNENS